MTGSNGGPAGDGLDASERSQLRYGQELIERGKRLGGDRLSDGD